MATMSSTFDVTEDDAEYIQSDDSLQPDSLHDLFSQELPFAIESPPDTDTASFLTLVTAISYAYSKGRLVQMQALNSVPVRPLQEGVDFLVSKSEIKLSVVSARDQRKSTTSSNKIVIKKVKGYGQTSQLPPRQISKLVMELRVLDHLFDAEHIVKLRGVGFFYDHFRDVGGSELRFCPTPVLMLEEALETLQQILNKRPQFSTETKLTICRDVTLGLLWLHMAGIGHGDIKPANVLIFPYTSNVEGDGVERFTAKISDFSQARLAQDTYLKPLGGTPPYRAPEADARLSVAGVRKADTWSLGILFAAVTLQKSADLFKSQTDPKTLALHIRQEAAIEEQESAWSPDLIDLHHQLYQSTLEENPECRQLGELQESFSRYFGTSLPRSWLPPQHLRELDPRKDDLFISYENFKCLSDEVKDLLVDELKKEAAHRDTSRRSKALFELGVIFLSKYANPEHTTAEGFSFIFDTARSGDIRARGLCHRFARIATGLGFETPDKAEILEWLYEAALRQHMFAMEDLAQVNPSKFKEVQKLRQARICDSSSSNAWHLAAVSNHPDELNRLLETGNSGIDAQDCRGDTPLVLAARMGRTSFVLRLLQLGANPALVNNIGENFLHHAWRLDCPSQEMKSILDICVTGRLIELFTQNAKGVNQDTSLAYLPDVPGLPLEGAAAKNCVPLVELMLQHMKQRPDSLYPLNRTVIRRILLRAYRLHHAGIQQIVQKFLDRHTALVDRSIGALVDTRWEYKSKSRTYLDAVALGHVSGVGSSPDLPVDFWALCCHGAELSKCLEMPIESVLQ